MNLSELVAHERICFNINYKVRVRLTDHGRAIHAAEHTAFWAQIGKPSLCPYFPPKEDADGWSEWQLWELMRNFGAHCGLAMENPFCTGIEFYTKDLEIPSENGASNA